MTLRIDEVTEVTPAVVVAFERPLPQLSPSAARLQPGDLVEIVSAPGTTLLLARDGEHIVGAVTVVCFRIPSGRRARIESLVVDPVARGRGVGRALCEAAIE